MITPRGGDRARDCSSASSSRMTCCERVLAEVSGLSRVSQAIPWPSRSIFQAELLMVPSTVVDAVGGGSCGVVVAQRTGMDIEIADQRAMIGEPHIGHPEVG